ncbi:nuclear transport factor 2 [Phyllostomus discolor]|uniref:Nuclear transport factor 2 n=1 Tax=Phyllostomus discolor TaxID=89673 RepID=A0A833YNI1_9CHIR|nr:nuclear transport factor 2 [Phyllostomus discolor]
MRHALRGKDSNSRGKLPLWRSCLAFRSRKSSTASRRRTISPRLIAASSAWLWASLRPMKTPSWDSTRCSY